MSKKHITPVQAGTKATRIDTSRLDPLILSDFFSVRTGVKQNSLIDVEISSFAFETQAGGVARLNDKDNPLSGIVFYFDGYNNVKCDEFTTATTWKNLINVEKAYAAGDHLILDPNGSRLQLFHLTASGTLTHLGTVTTTVHSGTWFGRFSTDNRNRLYASFGGGQDLQETWREAGNDTFSLQPHPGVINPVLTSADVTDLADATGLADPFVVLNGNTYYLFHEVMYNGASNNTAIAYSYSLDGLTWTYGQKIFSKTDIGAKNISYPFVFKVGDIWYMIPETQSNQITAYRATKFPTAWIKFKTVCTTLHQFRDASIFNFRRRWYILAFDPTDVAARLYHSVQFLDGGFVEHPSSPILFGGRNSRPGGRPIVRNNVVDIFLQDNVVSYGRELRIYQLRNLSDTTVTVAELGATPILAASGRGWNANGMHTLDRVTPNLSIVDGLNGNWSIGVYQDVP